VSNLANIRTFQENERKTNALEVKEEAKKLLIGVEEKAASRNTGGLNNTKF
jgi:hypothetical protein